MTWLRSRRASARVLNVKACSEPGIIFSVGHGPEGQDQLVVGQLARFARRRPGGPRAGPGRCPGRWPRRTGSSAGTRGWGRSNAACPGCRSRPRTAAGHEEEVVPAHQDDLDVRPALAELLQVAGRVDPAEAAAEDDDPGLRVRGSRCQRPPQSCRTVSLRRLEARRCGSSRSAGDRRPGAAPVTTVTSNALSGSLGRHVGLCQPPRWP